MPLSAGSPPPPPTYTHLITGDSSEFTAGLGSWTATGGTMTRDTVYRYGSLVASLKHVTTAAGHRVDLPVAGTFKAGAEYVLFMAIALEETGIVGSVRHQFGLIGTDVADSGITPIQTYMGQPFRGAGSSRWGIVALRWKPTANRSGVSVRVERPNGDSSNTQTWHVGWVKAFRIPVVDGPASVMEPGVTLSQTRRQFSAPSNMGSTSIYQFGNDKNGGLYFGPYGYFGLDTNENGIDFNPYWGMYCWADPNGMTLPATTGDLVDVGFNWEVGPDYVGWYASELDADTIQFYADTGSGYMMQLRHRGTSDRGWSASDDGIINARIDDFWYMERLIPGTLTTGTDKCLHIVVPYYGIVESGTLRAKTAPTGDDLVVDVKAEGVSVFGAATLTMADGTQDIATGGHTFEVFAGDIITIDITQIGSGVAGSDLTVMIRGRYTWEP